MTQDKPHEVHGVWWASYAAEMKRQYPDYAQSVIGLFAQDLRYPEIEKALKASGKYPDELCHRKMIWSVIQQAGRRFVPETIKALESLQPECMEAISEGLDKSAEVPRAKLALDVFSRLGIAPVVRSEHTGKDGGAIEVVLPESPEAKARLKAEIAESIAKQQGGGGSDG